MKSEPFAYSFDDLVRDGKGIWDGVRNYQARNNLKAMKQGDQALFYHSNEGLCVVGIIEITHEHYPDPTTDDARWVVVEVAPVTRVENPVTLKAIKAHPELQEIGLIKQSRLSVIALTPHEFETILEMGTVDNG